MNKLFFFSCPSYHLSTIGRVTELCRNKNNSQKWNSIIQHKIKGTYLRKARNITPPPSVRELTYIKLYKQKLKCQTIVESRISPLHGKQDFSSTHDPETYSVRNVSTKNQPLMSRYVTLLHDPEFTFIQSPDGTFPFLLLEVGSFLPNSH